MYYLSYILIKLQNSLLVANSLPFFVVWNQRSFKVDSSRGENKVRWDRTFRIQSISRGREVPQRLGKAVRRRENGTDQTWKLLRAHATARASLLIRDFLEKPDRGSSLCGRSFSESGIRPERSPVPNGRKGRGNFGRRPSKRGWGRGSWLLAQLSFMVISVRMRLKENYSALLNGHRGRTEMYTLYKNNHKNTN